MKNFRIIFHIKTINLLTILFGCMICFILNITPVRGQATPRLPKPPTSTELIETGQQIYVQRCSFCHGLLGDGNGPAAEFMDPRPRDFTLATYKFRSTQSGELPLDEDLFRTISRGLSGTSMGAFDNDKIKTGLSEKERWAVIYYIKTFSPEFEDPELDPITTGKVVSLPSNKAPYNANTIAQGKKVFNKAKCWECHGRGGRGDGEKSFDKIDDWGFPIRIRNVTHPWKIKAGSEVEDIYMRFSTGISGTPMPSFLKSLSEKERWYLANYIKSLQHKLTSHQVLVIQKVEGALPETPTDEMWDTAKPMDVRLTGQVISAPRWQNPSIEIVTVRALTNGTQLAFQLSWDDPFKDVTHKNNREVDLDEISKIGAYNSYVKNDIIPRQLNTFRDSIALQFPIKPPEGTKNPHFYRGNSSNPVHLWIWKADKQAQGRRSVDEAITRGWQREPKIQGKEQQQVSGKAIWDQGRWTLIMKRPLITNDKNDVQFIPGQFIPIALNAWDGSNGEHKRIMSLSNWYYVVIESPIPITVYLYTLLGILMSGGICIWLVHNMNTKKTV